MAAEQKNKLVEAKVNDNSGNTYTVKVSNNGPDKGKIISTTKIASSGTKLNEPLSFDQSSKLYTDNKTSWDSQINRFLLAESKSTPGTSPTTTGLAEKTLYDQEYNRALASKDNTANTAGAAAGESTSDTVTSYSPVTITPPPSTAGKIYVFPEDLNIGTISQDYIRIAALKYQAPQPGLFTFDNENLRSAPIADLVKELGVSKDILRKGIVSVNAALPKNMVTLGETILPMPMQITDGAKTEWSVSKMNVLGASMASALSAAYNSTGVLGEGGQLLNLLGVGGQATANVLLGGAGTSALSVKNANSPDAADIIQADVIAQIVSKVSSTPVTPGDLLTRSTGAAVNPNAELLFRTPSLRTFDLQWKLTPRSENEAALIRKIIRFFKINMLPIIPQEGAALLQSPNVFLLRYNKSDGSDNPSLPKPKLCALGQVIVNHTPDGVGWAAYQDSHPVATTLQMTFLELTPLLANDFAATTEDDVGI